MAQCQEFAKPSKSFNREDDCRKDSQGSLLTTGLVFGLCFSLFIVSFVLLRIVKPDLFERFKFRSDNVQA